MAGVSHRASTTIASLLTRPLTGRQKIIYLKKGEHDRLFGGKEGACERAPSKRTGDRKDQS